MQIFEKNQRPDFTHKILRVELAFEGLRYNDLLRWGRANG